MTDRQRRLPIIGYAVLALAVAAALLLVQSYARDTRDAVRETRRLAITVAHQRRVACEDNNDRWDKLGDVLRPFRRNPMQTPQQRKTLEDLLRVTDRFDCSTLELKKEP